MRVAKRYSHIFTPRSGQSYTPAPIAPLTSPSLVPCPDGSGFYCLPPVGGPDVGGPCGGNTGIPCPVLPLPRVKVSTCQPGWTIDPITNTCMPIERSSPPFGLSGVLLSDIKKKRKTNKGAMVASQFGHSDLVGLGDTFTPGVAAGTRIHFEADVSVDIFDSQSAITNCLLSGPYSLGPALVAVQINIPFTVISRPRISIDGTVAFDRGNVADVQSDILASLTGCGLNASNPSMVIVSGGGGIPTGMGQSPVSGGGGLLGGLNLPAVAGVGFGTLALGALIFVLAVKR